MNTSFLVFMLMRISYDDIVKRIIQEKGMSKEEIDAKISYKLKQLSDLISKEGAAHIVANELGVKVLDDVSERSFKINDLVAGLRGVSIAGKIVRIYDIREFEREGVKRKVGTFMIGDESGVIRTVIWDEPLLEKFPELKEDAIVKVSGGYIRDNNMGYKEIHLGNGSAIVLNPEGVKIGEVKFNTSGESSAYIKKQLKDINETDRNIGVLGTIVQVFEPRFYDACPECNKKVLEGRCVEHGAVSAKAVPILNVFFDDGTNNVRAVFFREQVSAVLGVSEEEVVAMRTDPAKFEAVKNNCLGKQIRIIGRVVKNDMFGRLEFMASRIEEVDPSKLIEEMGGHVEESVSSEVKEDSGPVSESVSETVPSTSENLAVEENVEEESVFEEESID